MTLDDLKAEWAARDRRLEKGIELNTQLLRESYVDRHGSSVRRWSLGGFLFELPFYIVAIAALGVFIVRHFDEVKFVVPALLLDVWCIAMLAATAYQFGSIYRLDFGKPVIALQKALVSIRMARLRAVKWGFAAGLLVWCAPFWIVIAKAALDVDLYVLPGFLAFNAIGCGVLAALIVWLLRRYSERFQRFAFVKAFLDSIAGRDLAKANEFMKRLSSFATEEKHPS